jgi:ribosomal protein S18 acetylase RimI-like enzyme
LHRLRPAAKRDRGFLIDLYATTRAGELAAVDWDDATKRAFVEHQFTAQDAHYRAHYEGATLDIVEVEGEPAGRLYVHRGKTDIRIMDISLAPDFRGRGLGTELLRALIREAEANGAKLSIHVESTNPARSLYERLGFVPVGEHGIYVLMERPPT